MYNKSADFWEMYNKSADLWEMYNKSADFWEMYNKSADFWEMYNKSADFWEMYNKSADFWVHFVSYVHSNFHQFHHHFRDKHMEFNGLIIRYRCKSDTTFLALSVSWNYTNN